MKKRTTGWFDSRGNEIFEGSRMWHPNGDCFHVVFDEGKSQWRALYDDGDDLCLGLQVSTRGQAIVINKLIDFKCPACGEISKGLIDEQPRCDKCKYVTRAKTKVSRIMRPVDIGE